MDCIVRISSLIDSMDALNQRRAKLLERYLEIERVNIDLQGACEINVVMEEGATGVALSSQNCKPGSENDHPPMIPKIIRVLQDMRQDLVLLRNLRAFLASLRQFNRFVRFSGQPFQGQDHFQDIIRGG
uniref:Uncharacterized protein n=1 Tax=Cuerna arida TaxID=1464854 RepID=A0A1B6EPK1_9HEMI